MPLKDREMEVLAAKIIRIIQFYKFAYRIFTKPDYSAVICAWQWHRLCKALAQVMQGHCLNCARPLHKLCQHLAQMLAQLFTVKNKGGSSIVLGLQLEVSLRMVAHGTDFRCLRSDDDVTAVAALPDTITLA